MNLDELELAVERCFPDIDCYPEDLAPPDYRATVQDGKVTTADWTDQLASGDSWKEQLETGARTGFAIADLTLAGEGDELLIVTFLNDGDSLEQSEIAIAGWASSEGCIGMYVTTTGGCYRLEGLAAS